MEKFWQNLRCGHPAWNSGSATDSNSQMCIIFPMILFQFTPSKNRKGKPNCFKRMQTFCPLQFTPSCSKFLHETSSKRNCFSFFFCFYSMLMNPKTIFLLVILRCTCRAHCWWYCPGLVRGLTSPWRDRGCPSGSSPSSRSSLRSVIQVPSHCECFC